MPWSFSPQVHGITWGPRRHSTPPNWGPLVLGSRTHLHLFGNSREPHFWLLSSISAPTLPKKQSLAFLVCPLRRGLSCLHTLHFLFMSVSPRSAGLASPCLAPRSHPASICFSGCLLHFFWGSCSSSQFRFCCCLSCSTLLDFLLFIPTLRPSAKHTHTPLQIVLFTPGLGSWALSCSSVCPSL